ncbi:hypothetical protein Daus18300_011295 [Diaporthe australafricana]|uniref:Uncharacterized protein n=1 Tax=Diaporthe australafricana TaxID=127596 RepID=A0ABR3W776_9PEZI
MSSRDLNAHFANYRRNRSRSRDRPSRPGPSRAASGDYARDRDRDRYYEHDDRYHEHDPRDRERRTDRDRERDSDLNRTHEPQDQTAKMDPDQASAELAKALRQINDLMTQKTQLSLKKDAELRAYHKRKQDYERQISKPMQFPAVQDTFQKYQNHHKQNLAAIDKELANLASKEDATFSKCAQTLVRALPINEIKIRQFLESAKGGLGLVTTSSHSAQDERLKKLEQRQVGFEETMRKEMTSLREAKELQASELARYRESDRLRADSAKENEQLQVQVASLKSEVATLTGRVELAEPLEALRAHVNKQVESLEAEIRNVLEHAKSQATTSAAQDNVNAAQDRTLLQMAALEQKCEELSQEVKDLSKTSESHTEDIANLNTSVDDHEDLLSKIDVERLDQTLDQAMTDYTALDTRVAGHDLAIDEFKRSVAESLARLPENMPTDLPPSFTKWSEKFVGFCGTKLDEHTAQIKTLQDSKSAMGTISSAEAAMAQASRPAMESTANIGTSLASELEAVATRVTSAESRLTEVESKSVAIESKVTASQETVPAMQTSMAALQDSITNLGSQADLRYGALETMVESLSSQWNNMSTTQMAHVILEHLSRLQPAQLVPEIRHFQERLAEVEKLIQEDGEQRKNLTKVIQSICDDTAKAPKRGLGLEGKYPSHPEKRARIEGQNGVNGYGNGYAHS